MPAMETESEMDDPNMHAYGDQYPDDSDQPLPPEGHPLRKLGRRLTELLEEHQWAECERLLLAGWEHDSIDRKTGADWRQNSSLEIWFPFTAEELGRWKRAAEANIGENVRLRAELDELRHNAELCGARRASEPTPSCAASPYDLTLCQRCGHEAPHHYAGCAEAK